MLSDRRPVCLSVLSVTLVLWPNGWTEQDETWHAGRPQPWPHCVRWGLSSPPLKGGGQSPPIFGPYLLWPNGWMDQDATWYGGRTRPRRLCVRWGPSSHSEKGRSPLPNSWPMSIVSKRLDGSKWHLAYRWALVQSTLCWIWTQLPSPKGGRGGAQLLSHKKGAETPPQFSAHFYCGQTARCHLVWR